MKTRNLAALGLVIASLWASISVARQPAHAAPVAPLNFLFVGAGDLAGREALLRRSDISGAQVVYSWKSLEPSKDVYDFSGIEADLTLTRRLNRKLFIQVQDRFFSPTARNVPAYLLEEPAFGGGLMQQNDHPGEGQPAGSGWVARQWDPAVRLRFQKLLQVLADRFDGEVFGINLPETAVDLTDERPASDFTCDGYFAAEMENMAFAARVFKRTRVVQYVNFWPCEWNNSQTYMARAFDQALALGVGMGGPDIAPWKPAQMKNAYPFFNRAKGRLSLVAMAVQEPTLTYTNPETGAPFSRADFVKFGQDYLGVDIIFWSPEAPWLSEPAD